MQNVLDFITANWLVGLGLSAGLLELIFRFVPSEKNRSIIRIIFYVLDSILPNLKKGGGTHTSVKMILVLFLLSASLTSFSQGNGFYKLYSSANADSAIAKSVAQNLFNTYGGDVSSFYYNHQSKKWRISYDNAGTIAWRNMFTTSGGGSGTITGGNEGLHRNGTNIRLGGTLNIDTVITGNGNLTFNNTSVRFTPGTLNVANPAGTFEYLFQASAIAADINVTLPLLTADDQFTFNNATQTLTNKTMATTGYSIFNPAGTFRYIVTGGAITANRTVTYPVTAVATTYCLTDAPTTNRLPYFSSNILTSNASYTFNPTGNVVTAGRFVGVTSATLPSLGLGAFAGDPSTLVNGDVWYSSTTNSIRARINGVSQNVAMNTTANNELTKSNGTATLSPSGLFSTASGDLTLGDAANAGTIRNINTQGTAGNIGISITPKAAGVTTLGGGAVQMTFNTADGITFAPNSIGFSNSTSTATQTFSTGLATGAVNGANLAISASNGSAGGGTGGNILLNAGSPLAGNNIGGNVTLTAGVGSGTGASGSLVLETNAGNGTLKLNDGANEQQGLATLVAGTVTVNNTKVTANTRIYLSVQTAGGTQGFLRIAARVAGTSFTITSTSGTETSTVAWLLIEPN